MKSRTRRQEPQTVPQPDLFEMTCRMADDEVYTDPREFSRAGVARFLRHIADEIEKNPNFELVRADLVYDSGTPAFVAIKAVQA